MNAQGFTLPEVLAAALLVLPMSVIVVQLVPRMMKLNVHSSAVMRAGLVCDQKKNQIWANCKGVGSGLGFSQNYTQSTVAAPSPYADLQIQVTDTTQGSLKTVVITVWKDLIVNSTKDASEPGALVTMVVQNGE